MTISSTVDSEKVDEVSERWLPVPTFEGLYEVSSLGRVRSIERTIVHQNGRRQLVRARVLSPVQNSERYLVVHLRDSRTRPHRSVVEKVHRLVGAAWLAGRWLTTFEQVNHLRGNRLDNRVVMLELCSMEENLEHSLAIGLVVRGESHPGAKFTDADVLSIRWRAREGESLAEIAIEFGVDRSTITRIVNRETWAHVREPEEAEQPEEVEQPEEAEPTS